MPRKKTQDEYEQQVSKLAPHVLVTGKYSGNRTPIEHYCLQHNIAWNVSPFNFLQRPTGCKECQNEALKRHHESIKKSNEQFVNEILALGTGITPLAEYRGYNEPMLFQCKEKHVWETTPHDIFAGYECPYCAGNRVLRGYNDLWTTDIELAKMLKDPEVGYTISRGSHREVEWICKNCGSPKMCSPKQVYAYGLACNHCSDGISYPNKFMSSLLTQLKISFITEYSPDWIKPYRYDFYFCIDGKNILVELDGGLGHGRIDYRSGSQDIDGAKRDAIKNDAAQMHSMTLIRIDCDYKNIQDRFNYIKNSILGSELNNTLDLSHISWSKCNEDATKSLHMEAAKLYDGGLTIHEISEKLNVSYSAVYSWLSRLAKDGLCSYQPVIGRSKK